ncbi:hypothetical protein [Oribacterium sp. HCP3S3_B9]
MRKKRYTPSKERGTNETSRADEKEMKLKSAGADASAEFLEHKFSIGNF